jgi:hypothetical protein
MENVSNFLHNSASYQWRAEVEIDTDMVHTNGDMGGRAAGGRQAASNEAVLEVISLLAELGEVIRCDTLKFATALNILEPIYRHSGRGI